MNLRKRETYETAVETKTYVLGINIGIVTYSDWAFRHLEIDVETSQKLLKHLSTYSSYERFVSNFAASITTKLNMKEQFIETWNDTNPTHFLCTITSGAQFGERYLIIGKKHVKKILGEKIKDII